MVRLIKAIINFFRGLFGVAASKLEDDVRDGKFAIEDSRERIADFRKKIAHLIASNKNIERKRNESKLAVDKWSSIANAAGAKQDWVNAEKALTSKKSAESVVNSLTTEINKTERIITNLKKQLETAQNKINGAESDITQLAARKDAADIRKGLAEAASGLSSGDNPLASLDKLKDKVNASEAEAEALEEISAGNTDESDLEALYGGGSGSAVNDELAALKEKFNKS